MNLIIKKEIQKFNRESLHNLLAINLLNNDREIHHFFLPDHSSCSVKKNTNIKNF